LLYLRFESQRSNPKFLYRLALALERAFLNARWQASRYSPIASRRQRAPATGVLTLTDAHVFGTDMTSADFVSFSYSSADLTFAVQARLAVFGRRSQFGRLI
jgi:hypothetical protein